MQDFASAFDLAFRLVFSADPDLVEIILLSLRVSLSAVGVALVLGLPLGATVAIGRFPGRTVLIVLFNALMGLPPVVARRCRFVIEENERVLRLAERLPDGDATAICALTTTDPPSRDAIS